jgi:hypothetical protein
LRQTPPYRVIKLTDVLFSAGEAKALEAFVKRQLVNSGPNLLTVIRGVTFLASLADGTLHKSTSHYSGIQRYLGIQQ